MFQLWELTRTINKMAQPLSELRKKVDIREVTIVQIQEFQIEVWKESKAWDIKGAKMYNVPEPDLKRKGTAQATDKASKRSAGIIDMVNPELGDLSHPLGNVDERDPQAAELGDLSDSPGDMNKGSKSRIPFDKAREQYGITKHRQLKSSTDQELTQSQGSFTNCIR
jgi:hypothetical protein